MNFTPFQKISAQFFLKEIQDTPIQNIYSSVTFLYKYMDNIDDDKIIKKITDILLNFKFLTFEISMKPIINDINQNSDNSLNHLFVAKFCCENHYFIIQNIKQTTILQIINILKKNGLKLINFLDPEIFPIQQEKEDLEACDEVKRFLNHYKSIINAHELIKNTLTILAGYLIRRFYCPSHFFSNPNFFNFDQNSDKSFENYFKTNLNNILSAKTFSFDAIKGFVDFLYNTSVQSIENKNFDFQRKYQQYEFKTDDFIKLRNIINTNDSSISLEFHIKSSYIFAIKKFNQDLLKTQTNHETLFCENFSHHCFTRFYGYLYKNGVKIGFVYEFMCNGTLNDFIKKPNNQILKNITLYRILRGINFLHSNSLIHRDIKPDNILFDHNFLPYINDFETIRFIYEDEKLNKMSCDVGSIIYASPEQYQGINVSFSTDIYSFGLIVYFIFKGQDLWNEKNMFRNEEDFYRVKKKENLEEGSINIKEIYNSCVEFDYSKRCSIEFIIKRIINEFNQMNDLQLLSQQNICVIIEYFFLNLCYISNQEKLENGICKYILDIMILIFKFLGRKIEGDIVNEELIRSVLALDFLKQFLNTTKCLCYFNLYFLLILNNSSIDVDIMNIEKTLKQEAGPKNSIANLVLGIMNYIECPNKESVENVKKYFDLLAENNNQEAITILKALNEGESFENIIGSIIEKGRNILSNDINEYYLRGSYLLNIDINEAFKYFKLAAEQNYIPSFYIMGYFYMEGICVKQDLTLAINYFSKSASNGDADALYQLGIIYDNGLGVNQNYNKAVKYYELSVENGNFDAYFQLGSHYENGFGVNQDYKKAIECYKKAPNNQYALLQLGNFHFYGKGCNKNYKEAKKYFELAAEQKNSIALNFLGLIYLYGYDVSRDISRAINYFRLSAEQNFPTAYSNIAIIYFNGIGVQKNYSIARKYYELAEKKNDSCAILILGLYYLLGIDVKIDITKAIEYFERSANLNNPFAFFYLGVIYLIFKEEINAKDNYLKAINYLQSSKTNLSDFFLGSIYSFNTIYRNLKKAIEHLKNCCNTSYIHKEFIDSNGHVIFYDYHNFVNYRSCNDLGLIFLLNQNDLENGLKYLQEAAFAEYPFGQNNYGLFLYYYSNEKKDVQHFFEKSSKNNFALAFYNLGYINEKNQNVEQSIDYYIKASKYANEPLYFHGYFHFDIGLEFSKVYIISLTNLKLTKYYWLNSDNEKSKDYFIKAFSSNFWLHRFQFRFKKSQIKLSFLYLKLYIFGNVIVLFNNHKFQIEIFQKEIENEQKLYDEQFDKNKENMSKEKTFEKENIDSNKMTKIKDKYLETEKEEKVLNQTDKHKFRKNDDQDELQIFEDPGKLFDFILMNNELHDIFINEINCIIETEEKIFYTPPYSILFGRIDFKPLNFEDDDIKMNLKNIDESFYEGFGL